MTSDKLKGLSQFEALVQIRKEHMLNPERSPSPSVFSPSTDWTESSSDDESSGSEEEEDDNESDSDNDNESGSDDGSDQVQYGGFVASAQFEVEDSL